MKEIFPDDRDLRPNDSFWDIGYHAGILNDLEQETHSLQAAGIAFDALASHRQQLLDYFYDDHSSQTEESIESLLANCRQIGLEFANYLIEYFAETPDHDERIVQTEDMFNAIYDSHARLLAPMINKELDSIWNKAALMNSLRKTYDQVPETAFIHIIQEHIQKKLEELVRMATL